MIHLGTKLEGVDGGGASVRGCPSSLGAVQAASVRLFGVAGGVTATASTPSSGAALGHNVDRAPAGDRGVLWPWAPPPSPLLVLARTKAGDCFARRVLPPTEAVALACHWVHENPGLVVEVVRADA